MISPGDQESRRRLMFIGGEDFNFLTYNMLVVLDELKCRSESIPFFDHRKLAFLIDFVSSPNVAEILGRRSNNQAPLSKQDVHTLTTAYAKGVTRQPLVARVTHALQKRNLLVTEVDQEHSISRLWLNKPEINPAFFKGELFALERTNFRSIRPLCSRLRTVKFETFIDRFFGDLGVLTWHS